MLNILNKNAYKLIFYSCSLTKPKQKSWKNILKNLDKYLATQRAVSTAQYWFYSTKKKNASKSSTRIISLVAPCQIKKIGLETTLNTLT